MIPKQKSLAFATWIGEKMEKDSWFKYHNGTWYIHMEGHLTTKDLYKIWIRETTNS